MSRGPQLFWFLNARKMPRPDQIRHYYTDLSITSKLKAARWRWIRQARKKGQR